MIQARMLNRLTCFLAAAAASILMLSACSSDEAAAIIADETVQVSGTITDTSGTGIGGATVKGIYSDNDPLNPSTTTQPDGTFTLTVLKNIAVSFQVSAANYITLNTAKEALSLDESGVIVDLPTTAEAQQVIDAAFGGVQLANVAGLAVDVVDVSDNEVGGETISTVGPADGSVYTDCDGSDIGAAATVACVGRAGPMYLAHFNTDSGEVTVTAGAESQLAPVRRGEITFLEFVQ